MKRTSLGTLSSALLLVGLAALAGVGCTGRSGRADAGPADAGVADAGPPAPPELQLSLQVEDADGGTQEGVLKAGEVLFVPAAQRLRMQANRALRNYRVRLFDEADRALESDDASDDTAAGTRYDIALRVPLRPGRKYAFVVDAQSGAMLSDASGNALTEQRFEVQTTGERVKDHPVTKASAAKRRHRRP